MHLHDLLNCPLSSSSGNALHVQTVVSRSNERFPPLGGIGGQLERGQEHRIAVDSVVAKSTGVHRNEFPLPCRFQHLEVGFEDNLSRQGWNGGIDEL